jgi:hypothetical protein
MYAAHRHHPERKVVDRISGTVFHRYDDGKDLFDPNTGILYSPLSVFAPDQAGGGPHLGAQDGEACVRIGEKLYLPRRRYRTAQGLRTELEGRGFRVLAQSGDDGENVVCVLGSAPGMMRSQASTEKP